MEKQIFRSRVSVLLAGFLSLVLVRMFMREISHNDYLGIYIFGGMMLFFALMLFGIRYIISENKLYLKVCWIIPFGSVDVTDIIFLKRSYNPLSSPAASLKRLYIHTRQGDKLISPVREQEFFDALKTINPDIRISVDDKKAWYRVWDWDI